MKMSFANACKTYYKKYTIRKNPSHKLKIKGNVSSVISETCAGANKKKTVRSPGTDGLFCFFFIVSFIFSTELKN